MAWSAEKINEEPNEIPFSIRPATKVCDDTTKATFSLLKFEWAHTENPLINNEWIEKWTQEVQAFAFDEKIEEAQTAYYKYKKAIIIWFIKWQKFRKNILDNFTTQHSEAFRNPGYMNPDHFLDWLINKLYSSQEEQREIARKKIQELSEVDQDLDPKDYCDAISKTII